MRGLRPLKLPESLGALIVLACGGVRGARPPERHVADGGRVVDAAVEAGASPMERLLAKHDLLAPGDREVLRRELDAAKEPEVTLPAFERDTCVRVAFDADAPTMVVLQDEHALALGNADGTSGMLGPSGPICFHKGDVATLKLTGQSVARIVVWASP